MKLFISVQVLIVTAAVIAGIVIRSGIPDAGIASISRYEDIRNTHIDCTVTVNMVPDSAFTAFDVAGRMYDNSYSQAIFVCTAEDSLTCANGVCKQRITVDKQISGICPEVGESVELIINGGIRRLPKEQYRFNSTLDADMPGEQLLTVLDMSGADYMKPGHSYLVSCLTREMGAVRYYGTAYGKICWLDFADDPDEFFYDTEAARNKAEAWKRKVLVKHGVE